MAEFARSTGGDAPVPGEYEARRRGDPATGWPDRPEARALQPGSVLALSSLVGNRATAQLLGRSMVRVQRDGPEAGGGSGTAAPPPKPRHTWVFIMGADPPGAKNPFYRHAKEYYDGLYGSAANSHVLTVSTLQQVMSTVTADGNPVGLLIVVSHGHPDGRLMFDLGVTPDAPPNTTLPKTAGGGTPTQFDTTRAAVDQGKLSTPAEAVIDAQTKIVIKGCNIGRSPKMVAVLKEAFGGRAGITASTHAQEFGGGQEHLAEYYVEKPGSATMGAAALAKEFESKYSAHVPNMDAKAWAAVAAKVKAEADVVDFEAFRGIVPAATDAAFKAGFSAQLADLAKDGATSIAFIKRTLNGTMFDYEFGYKKLVDGAAQALTGTVSVEAPPDDATAISAAKAASGRPDAYTYEAKKTAQGKETVVTVIAKRTEWKLKHTVIKDKSGKPIAPPAETDTFWYTQEAATAPAPAAP